MNEFQSIGKFLIIAGMLMIVIGLFTTFGNKIPLLGKLPGDILWKGENFTFFFPIVSSILLSIIFSIILYFLKK